MPTSKESPPKNAKSSPPLYESSGDLLVPGELARGPWFPNVQHGGAVAALLARAMEELPASSEMRITSLNVELFRKVPMDPVRVEAQIIRDGRRIGALAASLFDADKKTELARASATRIRIDPSAVEQELVPPPFPEDLQNDYEGEFRELVLSGDRFNYPSAFEAYVDSRDTPGRGWSWWRLKSCLVDEEQLSPFVRTAATADLIMSANSIFGMESEPSSKKSAGSKSKNKSKKAGLPNPKYLSINPDLFVSLQRELISDWICLESVVRIEANGIGETDAVLYDCEGRFARANKSLLIERY